MSGETVAVASRHRAPPGGPLRSLLWWLRPPHRSSSEESVSSVGSDRTTVSFAFLPPANYRTAKPVFVLPPPGPPTDSYRRRIRDRDLRRHLDREITLQRKYRLPSAADGTGYNAFSLPPARRIHSGLVDKQERARRATSECDQRRIAHVPGKRRAPQPPASSSRHTTAGATLPRRSSRKRRAPPPPSARPIQRLLTIDEKSFPADNNMDSKVKAAPEKRSIQQVNRKVDEDKNNRSRNIKTKSEVLDHGFFKHCKIFDYKKRASTSNSPLIRALPNISELDRQASEIYESCKLKGKEQNNLKSSPTSRDGHPWICTKCLKKYAPDVIVCTICYPKEENSTRKINQQNASSCTSDRDKKEYINGIQFNNIKKENRVSFVAETTNRNKEDKEKLKKILKEMKHSLPNHSKSRKSQSSDNSDGSGNRESAFDSKLRGPHYQGRDMPTLRIGCSVQSQSKDVKNEIKYDSEKVIETSEKIIQRPVITETTVLSHFVEIKAGPQSSDKESEKNNTSLNKKENTEKRFIENNGTSSDNSEIASTATILTPSVSNILNNNGNVSVKDDKISNKNILENKDVEHNKYEHSGILKLLNISNVSTDKIKPLDDQRKLPLNSNKGKDPVISSHLTKPEKSSQQETQIDNEKNVKSSITPENIKQGNFMLPPFRDTLQIKDKNPINLRETATNASTSETSFISNFKNISGCQLKPIESVSTAQISKNRELEKETQQATVSTALFSNLDSRRRDLVNQLERSIAQGDEHAAAEAAMGLAKMRVPCSVLSAPSILNTVAPEISKPLTITGLINSLTSNNPPSAPIASTSSTKTSETATHLMKPIVPTTSTQLKSISSEFQKKSAISLDKVKSNKENNTATKTSVTVNISNKPSTSSNVATSNVQHPNKVEAKVPISTSNVLPREPQLQTVDVIVEDRELQRGPVPVFVPNGATLGELRRRAELALGIPERLQRWIIGKTLCNDEEIQLVTIAGPALDAPFYLCLVESETNRNENCIINGKSNIEVISKPIKQDAEKEVYKELVELERYALIPTGDEMECGVCLEPCERGAGAVLRECLHAFCRDCLAAAVRHCDEPVVACPAVDCGAQLQEREVRALVSAEDYEKWLARGLATAESGARHAFHCRTTDCGGWALCEPGVRRFHCPVCNKVNCVPCQAIHEGETCEQHRNRALVERSTQEDGGTTTRDVDEGTRALLDNLVARGEALECPDCSAIITKKWGCDWVRCSACKTEICWVTRGRRWGPGGRGDTSGGCRCGIDGRRCHPSCSYCH